MPRMKMGPKGRMKKPGGMLKKPNTPGEKGRMVKGMITKALADLRKGKKTKGNPSGKDTRLLKRLAPKMPNKKKKAKV
jgi:hypothetical protein|tara:strand:+ start:533 stop:766 length:234 start_codon:yes stop_codon:yes gene_type:complete